MNYADWMKKTATAAKARSDQQLYGEADAYKKALERAVYGDAASQYGAGINQITNYLAGAGPLADSGAGTALRAKLYSSIYGGAGNRIAGSYAEYLKSLMDQRRQYNYQLALLKAQKKAQSTGFGGFLGGVTGAVGGPFLGAVGKGLGEKVVY